MTASRRFAVALACAGLLLPAGCGGEGAETTDTGAGAAQFKIEGGDNSVQEFGSEASGGELEQAAAALQGFLDARAERDWAAACRNLSDEVVRGLPFSCVVAMRELFGGPEPAALRSAAIAAGSLRVDGRRGFLIYRGAPRGAIYAVAMAREAAGWKVGSLAPVPLG